MTDPSSYIARKIAIKKHASTVPTGIVPMSQIRRATVFIDSFDADASPTRKAVKDYFDPLGIAVKIICPQKWDINLFGWLKPERPLDGKDPGEWNEDLFISMTNDDKFFASEYAARCSKAKFKVGRRQLKGKVFDLVVTNPEDKLPLQHVVFKCIVDYLNKIQ